MTEKEWLACEEPLPMLSLVNGNASGRNLRLFACACCRRLWAFLPDARSRTALAVLESEADSQETPEYCDIEPALRGALRVSRIAAAAAAAEADPRLASRHASWAVVSAAEGIVLFPTQTSLAKAIRGAGAVVEKAEGRWGGPPEIEGEGSELAAQSDLIRDIFGNPFRPVAFSPEWRTDTAVALAKQMYESRDFGTMPILADALQDAGCDNADILDHCRNPKQVHVRGCWVVDLVLGKE